MEAVRESCMTDHSVRAATETTFDPRAFRRALGNFATGVTVVTAADRLRAQSRGHRQQLQLGVP